MSLLQQIKKDQMAARKSRDAVTTSALTTLLSEASTVGFNDGKRESTDGEVVAVVRKFIKNLEEVIKHGNEVAVIEAQNEIELFSVYLPQQLSEEQLTNIIAAEVAKLDSPSMRDMGKLMAILKTEYDGQYDGALASKLVKSLLA